MSKATCITDQIGFLWKITCKHTVSNLAQKCSFATAKKSTYLGMGFGEQPSHPHRPKFAPKHFTALPPHLLGKVSAVLKRWICPYAFKGLTIPDSQFSHELPMTGLALPAARLEDYIPSLLVLLMSSPQTLYEYLTLQQLKCWHWNCGFYMFIQSPEFIFLGNSVCHIRIL